MKEQLVNFLFITLSFFLFLFVIPSAYAVTWIDSSQGSVTTLTGNLTNLSQMQDVSISSPSDNQIISFNSATSSWINELTNSLLTFADGWLYFSGDNEISFNTTRENQTIDERIDYYGLVDNSSYLSTYNVTYDSKVTDNESWNESYAGSLYAGIVWNHNETIPAITYTDSASNNLQTNISEIINSVNTTIEDLSLNSTEANLIYLNLSGTNVNQDLNVSPFNFLSNNLTVYNNLKIGEWLADTLGLTLSDDGSNLELFADVGGNNYFGIDTSGSFFQLYANPNPSNDYLLATITETQGADTQLNFYEGGTGHNRFWDSGSARFGGSASYLCSNLTTDVDCDTSGTGADIVVQDDGWFGGKLFSSDWSNITRFEQIYNHTSLIEGLYGKWFYNQTIPVITYYTINLPTDVEGIFNSSSWKKAGTNVFLANIGDNVGIGTISPNALLQINGSTTVFLNITNGSNSLMSVNSSGDLLVYNNIYKQGGTAVDYVFDDYFGSSSNSNYSGLLSLDKLGDYIQENRHLPNMEKEKYTGKVEVGKLGEMNLEKIEELTLYVVELKEENDKLKQENFLIKQKFCEEFGKLC